MKLALLDGRARRTATRTAASQVRPTAALPADREALAEALACALYAELQGEHARTVQTGAGIHQQEIADVDS
jgi:hypothetical protein